MKNIKQYTFDIYFVEKYMNGYKLEFKWDDTELLMGYEILENVNYWTYSDLPERIKELENDDDIITALKFSYLRVEIELDENNKVSSISSEII